MGQARCTMCTADVLKPQSRHLSVWLALVEMETAAQLKQNQCHYHVEREYWELVETKMNRLLAQPQLEFSKTNRPFTRNRASTHTTIAQYK